MKTGVSVVIPCLNESKTLARAIANAFQGIDKLNMPGEVIVVDNGSSDGSANIAIRENARIIYAEKKGYGSAIDAGVREAKFSFVVFADADLSYAFEDIHLLIDPLVQKKADFVLGSRIAGDIEKGAMPFLNRHLGTPVLSQLIFFFYGLKTSDCNSGMRAFLTESYSNLKLSSSGMEYASEMLIKVSKKSMRFLEVPIRYQKDQRERPPHLNRFRDGIRHLLTILKHTYHLD